MKLLKLIFATVVVGLAFCKDTSSAPMDEATSTRPYEDSGESTPTTTQTDDDTTAGTTFLPLDDNSKESDEKNSSVPIGVEEDIVLIFFKRNNNSDLVMDDKDRNGTKKLISISKRSTDRLIQSNVDKDGDDKDKATDSESEDNFNSTSKEEPADGNSTTDIILLPLFRPRPILIDIIFFRVNDTRLNRTGPHFPSHSGGGQGIGHSKPINSDEDSSTFTPIASKLSPTTAQTKQDASFGSDNEISTRNKSSSSEEVDDSTVDPVTSQSSDLSHNRTRRDTIFSHFTNNSQSTTSNPDDEDILRKATFSSSSGANNANVSSNNTDSPRTMSTKKTRPTTQETNNAESVSNQPQFGFGEGERSSGSDNKKNLTTMTGDEQDEGASSDTTTTTTTANPVVSFFIEIIQYGENVTNALFGKVGDKHNANPKRRNSSESSGSKDGNNDHDEGLSSRPTGSTFTFLPTSSSAVPTSNQNSTKHQNQHPGNGSNGDLPVQLEQK